MLRIFDDYKGLPREVYILFTANVINRFGDFVSPLLALYLTQKLHLSEVTSSIIVTIALLSFMPGAFVGGKTADHIGRKKTYIIMQTLAGLMLLPCAFIQNPYILITLIIASTFFNGAVRPSLDALAIDLMPEDKRKTGIALMYLGINLGVAVGPALAGFLFKVNLPLFFMIDTITSLIAVTLVYLMISDRFIEGSTQKDIETQKELIGVGFLTVIKDNMKLMIFMFISAAFSLIWIQNKFALPLLFSHEFGENGSALLGTIFSINAFTCIFFTSIISHKTKKFAIPFNMALGAVLYAVGFGLYGVVSGYPLYAVSTVVWTLGEIVLATNIKVYIADKSPVAFRGRINAVYIFFSSGMKSLGVLLSGWLIPVVGYNNIWYYACGVSMILAIAIMLIGKNEIETSKVRVKAS